jgi:hypothetical protein
MLAKVIPTRVHGVIDYLSGILYLVLPRLLGWGQAETWLLSILGVSVIVYSILTRYELGVVKLIPMPVHLILDLLGGVLLVAAPFLFFENEPSSVTTWYLILGIFELGASLLTDTAPRLETGPPPVGSTQVYDREGSR